MNNMENNQEDSAGVEGTRATDGPTSESTVIKKKDHILQRIQPTNAAGFGGNVNVLRK